jgi:rootletin
MFFDRFTHDKRAKELNNQIVDLNQQRETALNEVAELKVQLKIIEEARDAVKRDLAEANENIRSGKILKKIHVFI